MEKCLIVATCSVPTLEQGTLIHRVKISRNTLYNIWIQTNIKNDSIKENLIIGIWSLKYILNNLTT